VAQALAPELIRNLHSDFSLHFKKLELYVFCLMRQKHYWSYFAFIQYGQLRCGFSASKQLVTSCLCCMNFIYNSNLIRCLFVCCIVM